MLLVGDPRYGEHGEAHDKYPEFCFHVGHQRGNPCRRYARPINEGGAPAGKVAIQPKCYANDVSTPTGDVQCHHDTRPLSNLRSLGSWRQRVK